MKRLWLIGCLCIVALCGSARAMSTLTEILPGGSNDPLGFDIRAEMLSDGTTRYTVLVSEKAFPIEDRWNASLDIVKVSTQPWGASLGEARTISKESKAVRPLPAERQGTVIKCVFSVTQSELTNPYLSFCFTITEKAQPIAAFDSYFFRLHKFRPSP